MNRTTCNRRYTPPALAALCLLLKCIDLGCALCILSPCRRPLSSRTDVSQAPIKLVEHLGRCGGCCLLQRASSRRTRLITTPCMASLKTRLGRPT